MDPLSSLILLSVLLIVIIPGAFIGVSVLGARQMKKLYGPGGKYAAPVSTTTVAEVGAAAASEQMQTCPRCYAHVPASAVCRSCGSDMPA